ncbi:MAG: hypothetical protein FWF12_03525 [Betaproteobacteria bacterium]|nr:hypothetical protein [Betaproteobacteria bacterium]
MADKKQTVKDTLASHAGSDFDKAEDEKLLVAAALGSAVDNILARSDGKPRINSQDLAQLNAVLQGKATPANMDVSTLLAYDGLNFAGHISPVPTHELTARLKGNERNEYGLLMRVCSDYRVTRTERAVDDYRQKLKWLWQTSSFEGIGKQIEAIAHDKGISVDKAVEQMSPDGELADFGNRFMETVKTNPDARNNMRRLDRALNSFIHQYKHGMQELLGTPDAMYREKWKARIDESEKKMRGLVGSVPKAFEEEPSHQEKLGAAVQDVHEKLEDVFSLLFPGENTEQEDTPGL